MLEIPSNIYSNTRNLWDDIQNKLQTATEDKTPFALFPVRLETRFMKVKRRYSPHVQSGSTVIIRDLVGDATDTVRGTANAEFEDNTAENQELVQAEKSLTRAIQAVEADSSSYSSDTKSTLISGITELETLLQNKMAAIGKSKAASKNSQTASVQELEQLIKKSKTLKASIEAKKALADTKTKETPTARTSAATYEKGDLLSGRYEVVNESTIPETAQATENDYIIADELWIRIFPDEIHINSHEKPLTNEEVTAGLDYWNTWWNSDGDLIQQKGAWKALCELYGPQRAAWIKEQLTPTNLPQETVDDDSVITWVQSYSHAGIELIKNMADNPTYPENSADVASQLSLISEELLPQIEGIKMSGQTKEDLLAAAAELEQEATRFQEMVLAARENPVELNIETLSPLDFSAALTPLSSALTGFRATDSKTPFNLDEWLSELNLSTATFASLTSQLENNGVDSNSLMRGKTVTGNLASEIQENEAILMAIPKGDPKNPHYQVIASRVQGNQEQIATALANVKVELAAFETAIISSLSNIKAFQIKNDVAGTTAVMALSDGFSQIRDQVTNAEAPVEWNVFDHIPMEAAPNFPTPETKNGAWTEAPKTMVLPDRFVAIGLDESVVTDDNAENYGENTYTFKQLEVGALVPAQLNVGIDPSISDPSIYSQTENGDLTVDEGMDWMVDFEAAVNKGMGIIMPLEEAFTPGQAENVFDKLVVMGVKVEKDRFHQPDASKDYGLLDLKSHSKDLLEELLTNHHYKEEGMGIVKIGTATNNTENADSGWKFDQVNFEDSFAVENGSNLFPIRSNHLAQANGQRLAEALGVDYSVFQHIENADSSELSDTFMMNKMLWHGTIGNYLQEMLSGLISRSNYEKVKRFYESYVSARGIIPSLRVGSQPYGILPTTSHSRWAFESELGIGEKKIDFQTSEGSSLDWNFIYTSTSGTEPSGLDPNEIFEDYFSINQPGNIDVANKRFHHGFKKLLSMLQNRWYGLFHTPDLVKHVGGVSGTEDFVKALGLHATTAEIQLRFPYAITDVFKDRVEMAPSQNTFAYLGYYKFKNSTPHRFFGLENLGDDWIKLVKNGLYERSSVVFSQDNIVNHIEYLDAYFELFKNPIDQYKLSEKHLINRTSDNYINWIKDVSLLDLWEPGTSATYPFQNTGEPLLFKLLRQSYLMMHLDAFVDISIRSGIMDPNNYHFLSNTAKTVSSLITATAGNIGTQDSRMSKWTYLLEQISDFAGATGNLSPLADYKTALDTYTNLQNISPVAATNMTFAEHLKNPHSRFWTFTGGAQNRRNIADINTIYNTAKSWSTAHIDRLFKENLDLGSYRLDAWMDGFVHKRLLETRSGKGDRVADYLQNGGRNSNKGIYIGAYGWLENVKPGGERTTVDQTDSSMPESLKIADTKIFADDDNLGFIQGPSLYHTMTAAILRSGYASNEDVAGNLDNPMAVNLSSERVRMAKKLWEGIKNGQNLGALLGYQLERNLHELYNDSPGWELDQYIYQLRKKYPTQTYHTPVSTSGAESIPAQNVVNGIDLLGDIREAMHTPPVSTDTLYNFVRSHISAGQSFSIQVSNPSIASAIAREIDMMANAIDALGDLAVAEGVFQLTKGNFNRASSTIDTILENSNLPMPEILETPRTGTSLSQKFCVNMEMGVDQTNTVINPWPTVALTPKATLAPHVNQLIGKYLPDPSEIRCLVQYTDSDGTPVSHQLSMVDLGWQPIDFYTHIIETKKDGNGEKMLGTIAHQVRTQLAYDSTTPIPHAIELTILTNERDGNWSRSTYSLLELLPVAEQINTVLANIKPIKNQDFSLPELTSIHSAYGWDMTELNDRIVAAHTEINHLITSASTNYEQLLTSAGSYFVNNTAPQSDDPTALQTQWGTVRASLQKIWDQVEGILNHPTNGSLLNDTSQKDDAKWKAYLKAAQLMHGPDFTLLPILDLSTGQSDVMLNDYLTTKQNDLMANVGDAGFDQDCLEQWFYQLAQLRKKIGAFEVLTSFDDTEMLEFSPLQFPYFSDPSANTHDYWYGWEFPEVYQTTGNKTAIVMTDQTAFQSAVQGQKMVGFILDEWSEMIPEKAETTGIAFHYDQPNSKPPQNILLAVTPAITGSWDANDLLFTLLDTLKMAKVRLVEPEHLQTDKLLGKYLPSTYALLPLEDPENNATNSPDLAAKYSELVSGN